MRFRHDIASKAVFFSLVTSLTHLLGGFQLLYHLVFTVLPCVSFTWAALPFYLVGLVRQFDYVFLVRAVWCSVTALTSERKTRENGSFSFKSKVYPYDIDWIKHMNNTKYLSVAKLARLTALLEAGVWRTPYQIVSYRTSYCKEIKLSQTFLVLTQFQLNDQDSNSIIIDQLFCDPDEEGKVFFKLKSEAISDNTSSTDVDKLCSAADLLKQD